MTTPQIRLTQYSHGAGCGCKISPAVLDRILGGHGAVHGDAAGAFAKLWVGNAERDDAAVFDLDDGTGIVSTTDFFMPIVDDPRDFGRIASVNAISDVYAMGGTPLVAIAILGWPTDKLSPEIAGEVVAGSREICQAAGIPLAGGHSIDCPEPIFGLAVTGRVARTHLKRNGGAAPGDLLYLTKPLGIGVITTAEKRGVVLPAHRELATKTMLQLNSIGAIYGGLAYVSAMTDVTGFGLFGHLREMCAASGTGAVIETARVPLLDEAALRSYIEQGCVPGGATRNWESYGAQVRPLSQPWQTIFSDPQTSGGLLVAVAAEQRAAFEACSTSHHINAVCIGSMVARASQTHTICCD
ncbi:MAG: selenide, water dikinase SelD [Myxococcales bacterium]|nr:selenide, water dikinase SelD [Myxococcales bacterium]